MNLLISIPSLYLMKSLDKVDLKCEYCSQVFTRTKNDVTRALANHPSIKCKFCSRKCRDKSYDKRELITCKQCGNDVLIGKKEILKTGNFCSHSCSALFYNKVTKKGFVKLQKIFNCRFCNKTLNKRGFYCDKKCQTKYLRDRYIKRWLAGEIDGSAGVGKLSNHVRRYLIELFGEKCSICGFNTPHPQSNYVPLEIDHIDGNWRNNHINNLKVLCRNCHALTLNFGSRNRGKGRHIAQKTAGYSTR